MTPVASPTAARILGTIPDGTPPPPAPPKPKLAISSKDVLHTTTHEQGGRTITIRASSHTGHFNGIAFGDPGNALAGRFEIASLGFTKKDIWFGDVVDIDADKTRTREWRSKVTKVTHTLNIDKEETRFWSGDEERNDIQLAGILMAWVHEQHDYKTWLAQRFDTDAGHVAALMMDKKHQVENIVKWAKRAEMTIETGGEVLASVLNEGAGWAFTSRDISQGEYMAMIGFIPGVPGSAAKTLKVLRKSDEATEPIKAYRVYGSADPTKIKANYFMYEKPVSKTQVAVDYALGRLDGGVNTPFQDYDRIVVIGFLRPQKRGKSKAGTVGYSRLGGISGSAPATGRRGV